MVLANCCYDIEDPILHPARFGNECLYSTGDIYLFFLMYSDRVLEINIEVNRLRRVNNLQTPFNAMSIALEFTED